MPAHSTLTGADLHEPKGAATAGLNEVYTADGAASGTWKKVTANMINTGVFFGVNQLVLTAEIEDVSTASSVYLVLPCACTLTKVYTVLQAAITLADSTITVRDHGGSSAGTITVANAGSAAGDIDSLTVSSNNTFTSGQRVRVQTDGASTDTAKLFITLVFTVTGAIS
jgi:hypothetical protein